MMAGRVAQTRTAAYARALRRRLDGLAETEPPPDARDSMGVAYGVVGKGYTGLRDWLKAIENYRNAMAWFEKTGQYQHMGAAYHGVGRVYQELATGLRPSKTTRRPWCGTRRPASPTRLAGPTTR